MNGRAKVIELATLKEIDGVEYEYQHGFTRGRSIATAHMRYWTIRKQHPDNKGSLFIDFSDAYNTVD